MSLRRKIIGAAARWAGSSAAPQWARQAVCGFHSTGAASAAAGAPRASPRGLLLSSSNVTPLIEASPPGVEVRRGVPRRGWLPSSDEAFCACVFRRTAWFPHRGPAGSRAPDPANHPSPKISAPTADLKIPPSLRQAKALTPLSTTSTMQSSLELEAPAFVQLSDSPRQVTKQPASPSCSQPDRTQLPPKEVSTRHLETCTRMTGDGTSMTPSKVVIGSVIRMLSSI